MLHHTAKTTSPTLLRLLLLLFIISLVACESMPTSKGAKEEQATETKTAQLAESTPADTATAPSDANTTAAKPQTAMESAKAEQPKAPAIVASCKDEPYVGYEQQARDSITKGLAATEAGKFGVGFRDLDEHKKWTEIHTQLFTQVNQSCQALSECAKQNAKDKATQCADQAATFNAWQELAAQFVEKAKQAETTQPPIICSFEPNLDDPQHCFHDLANNVDKVCSTEACKDLGNCWRGVGFLDAAILQAEQACGFAHTALDDCRGYTEAKGRRVKKFEQCKAMQAELNISAIPPL